MTLSSILPTAQLFREICEAVDSIVTTTEESYRMNKVAAFERWLTQEFDKVHDAVDTICTDQPEGALRAHLGLMLFAQFINQTCAMAHGIASLKRPQERKVYWDFERNMLYLATQSPGLSPHEGNA